MLEELSYLWPDGAGVSVEDVSAHFGCARKMNFGDELVWNGVEVGERIEIMVQRVHEDVIDV